MPQNMPFRSVPFRGIMQTQFRTSQIKPAIRFAFSYFSLLTSYLLKTWLNSNMYVLHLILEVRNHVFCLLVLVLFINVVATIYLVDERTNNPCYPMAKWLKLMVKNQPKMLFERLLKA